MVSRKLAIVGDPHLQLTNPIARKGEYCFDGLNKVQILGKDNDGVFFLGDMFHKAVVADELKNTLLSMLINLNKNFYSIEGNHDIQNDNPDTLYKTSLGNLGVHKSLEVLKSGFSYEREGLTIGVLPYHIKEAQKFAFDKPQDLVLGHHFYEWSLNPEVSLQACHLEQYNTKRIFLGHDHQPHEEVCINGVTIYRPGSMLRTSLQQYTLTHKPSYYQISLADDIITSVDLVEIPHKSAREVFKLEERKELKACVKLVSDIKKFLENTSIAPSEVISVSQVLIELNSPPEVFEYLQTLHRVLGLEF